MFKRFQVFGILILIISLFVNACTQQTAQPATNQPTLAVAKSTQVVEPTRVLADPDYAALFSAMINAIPTGKAYASVSPAILNQELTGAKPPFLLDLREASEVKDGFIEGAVNIPIRMVLRSLDKLPGVNKNIIVYSATGHRGGMVMAALRLMGYPNVRNLNGGYNAWKNAKLPVVTGKEPVIAQPLSTVVIADQALYNALDDFMANLPNGYYSYKAAKASELLSSATPPFLLDVRSQNEWDNDGYIKGAVNVPITDLFTNLSKLPANKTTQLIVYDGSGHRGGIATLGLHMLGYENVYNITAGLGAWKSARLPIVGWVDWKPTWNTFLASLPADYYSVMPDVLNRQLADKPPFLLDVRETVEVAKDGYIKGSVNIPIRDLMENLDKLPAFDQPIVVYCGSGHRGAMVVPALLMLGWKDVRSLSGGLAAWMSDTYTVVSGTPAAPTAGKPPKVDSDLVKGFAAYFLSLPEDFYLVKAADLSKELKSDKKPVVVDVRTEDEFSKEHIEGSTNIPITKLFVDMSKLPADKSAPIVISCASGHRSAMALIALRMNGYTNARSLFKGVAGWKEAKLPVVAK